RYLCGQSEPAEKDQIQTWLSCTDDKKTALSKEEREWIENEIIGQVNAYVTSSLFVVKPEPWWKKITAFF
ncbi:MAG: hypothetical protein JNN00_16075, partial [Chitinophagaceae bacterium]|nr:hypothetical protein [Chitinophagaceae bacterium]